MGTAYGCLRDTEQFLGSLVEQQEEMLSPTSFIQSTHNTVGAQIALLLQCNSYNNTFVNGGFSFENALLDAVMMLRENEATHVLTGSADELTDISHTILGRFGLYKREPVNSEGLYTTVSRGTIAGEGAAFFLLSAEPSANDLARLEELTTFYGTQTATDIADNIKSFLAEHSLTAADIDLVITGKNGDPTNDAIYNELANTVFTTTQTINYKHFCGEYPTAVSFAVWLAAQIIKTGQAPEGMKFEEKNTARPQRILICNNYQQLHHSLILISA
jgi:3-oxoacyl-(acyl-carrier-protein) synthase